ncbi:MAG: hypothetical protein WCF28_06820 [Methanobacterium sp.]|uniref:hypothetical protein n=1 Tax=Methanobacterium sp. TaxID=2164 RepID=UPI003C767CB0
MDDTVQLSKVETFKGLFGNNLFRVLIVVIGTDIGAAIGFFYSQYQKQYFHYSTRSLDFNIKTI